MDNDKDTIIIGSDEFDTSQLKLDDYIIDTSILTSNTMNSTAGTTYSMNNQLYSYPTITIGPNTTGTAPNNQFYTINNTNITPNTGLKVTSDAEFDGDIKWKGRSLGKWLEDVEKRLAILVPDPEKLEHFEALKKAYQHYKTLEALCEMPNKTKE